MTTGDHLPEFDDFYRRHRLPLEGYLTTRLNIPREVVEEVVPEAFMAMRRRWARVRTPSPKAYLFMVARNAAFGLAKQRRYQPRPCVSIDVVSDMPTSRSEADELADRLVTQVRVKRLLSLLSSQQREIVILRYVEGFSVRETAAIMKIASSTVTSSVTHARRRLQSLADDSYDSVKEVRYL